MYIPSTQLGRTVLSATPQSDEEIQRCLFLDIVVCKAATINSRWYYICMYICPGFYCTHTLWQLFPGSYTYSMPSMSWLTCVHMYTHIRTPCQLWPDSCLIYREYIRSLLHIPWPICVVVTYCSSEHPHNRRYIYTHNDPPTLLWWLARTLHWSRQIHTHIHANIHAHIHSHTYTHTYIHTYIHT